MIKSLINKIKITEENNAITGIEFASTESTQDSALIKEAKKQLTAYFAGDLKIFDLPIKLNGTDFQVKVWNELLKIPYGETRSYKDIATKISPKAYRAVGMANNKNPIAIVVPCHRVIGANGKLVGYAGGLDIKEFLLNLEKKNK